MMRLKNFASVHVVLSFLLVTFTTHLQARKIRSITDPPCYFNPLCTCSKSVPDLGIVRCRNTLLAKIPKTINSSKAFMLELTNVGLRSIAPYFLQSTGLNKLTITENPLHRIADDAFVGLERTLWRLELAKNKLLDVPTRALRYLQKLRYLDLSGNAIIRVFPDNWNGLENSLETLILSDNQITHLSPDTFAGLPYLDTINLKGNNLKEIDASVFREGMDRLAHIILADNQLSSIPYLAVSPLRMLKTLDLSHNRINKMLLTMESGSINIQLDMRLSLDVLNLHYNEITTLESGSFQYFNVLNTTFMDGNPLSILEDNAFQQAKIRELYMRNCEINEVTPAVFAGLENYLHVLDMSGNNIQGLEIDFLIKFVALRTLSLGDNLLKGFAPIETINGFQHTLIELDLGGTRGDPLPLDSLRRLRNLRSLRLGRLTQPHLAKDDFMEFGADLENLHVNFAGLQIIKNRAFGHLHALKHLDLSENSISQIENEAFLDVGHSLISLKISHGLSSSMVPVEALKVLTHLELLDLSNNKISSVADNSFHFLRKLKILELQDNEIGQIHKGTFQGDIHLDLEAVYLSFNNIRSIQQHTFANLPMLEQLHLDDNRIETVDRGSFSNLENLKRLNLKGNKLSSLSPETFQNLPELEDLDMSYNRLNDFQFNVLDQVGTLATFSVNVSHNRILDLISSEELESGRDGSHSNIKILDLSHNNISQIIHPYFRPIELSLTHLFVSHNLILNATRDIFGNMPHLQWLDLSHNRILELGHESFKNTRSLQAVFLSHNYIAEMPRDLFRTLANLRVVDLSHNRMRYVPDNLFREEGLERLDLSHNQLTRVPLSSLSYGAAATLCELDLSVNAISSVMHEEMLSKFESLCLLDLSHNKIVRMDLRQFSVFPTISTLDLSHNGELNLNRQGRSFQGIQESLLFLKLENLSLALAPDLPLDNLISLSLARNSLTEITTEMIGNLSSLRSLNLAHNDLGSVPIAMHSLTNLKALSLAGNPISVLSNTSLLSVANHLVELDITNLPLNEFEHGALHKMMFLKSLRIGAYTNVRNFNIPDVVESNFGLEHLEVNVDRDTNLKKELSGTFPVKLHTLTLSGRGLKNLDGDILQGIRSAHLNFIVKDTGLSHVPSSIFYNLPWIRNLSVEIHDNNNLQTFDNPITGNKPSLSTKTFLLDLSLRGNKWSCDCSLGWMEVWQRKKRQYLCEDTLGFFANPQSPEYSCRHAEDYFRTEVCINKANLSMIEALKTDIECGWNSASLNHGFSVTFILIVVGVTHRILILYVF